MLQRLRNRAQGHEGFTLIELLVVILIIGILAAVAIPTFLSQTNKAKDSNVQAYLNSAQTAEATYQTSNGAYTATVASLKTIEPTLNSAPSLTAAVTATGFTVSDISTSDTPNVTFTLAYNAQTGTAIKSCNHPDVGGCNHSGSW